LALGDQKHHIFPSPRARRVSCHGRRSERRRTPGWGHHASYTWIRSSATLPHRLRAAPYRGVFMERFAWESSAPTGAVGLRFIQNHGQPGSPSRPGASERSAGNGLRRRCTGACPPFAPSRGVA
jgi:hypothetical protein